MDALTLILLGVFVIGIVVAYERAAELEDRIDDLKYQRDQLLDAAIRADAAVTDRMVAEVDAEIERLRRRGAVDRTEEP